MIEGSSNAPPQPTGAELAILNVLWERGPLNVRDVSEALAEARGEAVKYTTALKLLQIMTEKGLVRRDETRRTHVYRAAGTQEQTQRRLVIDLLDRAFNGSAKNLILQALSSRRATARELAEIRRMLDEHKGKP